MNAGGASNDRVQEEIEKMRQSVPGVKFHIAGNW